MPYTEVYVALTLTLDEAAAIQDMVSSLKHADKNVQRVAVELGAVLDENLERAAAYKARKQRDATQPR